MIQPPPPWSIKKVSIKNKNRLHYLWNRLYFDMPEKFLTSATANAKIAKGIKYGFLTYGIHFAPFNLSGRNVCPNASAGCAAACLNTAGRGVYQKTQLARARKTQAFFADRKASMLALVKEIQAAIRKATRENKAPAFRLNLTSDVPWENIKISGKNLMEIFPTVQFYDYTKSPHRMEKFLSGDFPANYHLTFSRSETNGKIADAILASGGNIAIVFKNAPETYNGKPVVDGDLTDLRFQDGRGVVVALKAKGKARRDTSGFVV
jgi:hypothetical protein